MYACRIFLCVGLCLIVCMALLPFAGTASAQQISAPEPQTGSIAGIVVDVDNAYIPGAQVILDGPTPSDHRTQVADQQGAFQFAALRPAVQYHVTVKENGFADWASPAIVLTPGQAFVLTSIKLVVAAVDTSVSAVASEEIALEQVKEEEKQRVFGVIPNFYVVYGTQFVPMPTKLKYKLALRTATDTVTFASSLFLAGIDQASDTPNYVQGAKGYGQRVGAAYAGAASDVLLGGAILPSLLHQDPRYFYQGTGTNKSRVLHAIASPFFCKGDDGSRQFNYSSIGGDLLTGALSEIYFPPSNRGPGLVFNNAFVTTGGRIANALAQEFLLSKFTSRGKPHN